MNSLKKLILILFSLLLLDLPSNAQVDETEAINTIGIYPIGVERFGFGAGAFYERSLNAKQDIAFHLPVTLNFLYKRHFEYRFASDRSLPQIQIAPGIKFYMYKNERMEFAMGPSLFYNFIWANELPMVEKGLNINDDARVSLFDLRVHELGLYGNGYMNVILSESFLVGAELGLGMHYYKDVIKTYYDNGQTMSNIDFFGFKGNLRFFVAYRF